MRVELGSYRFGCWHLSSHVLDTGHLLMMRKSIAIHSPKDHCNASVIIQYRIVRNKSSNTMRVGINGYQSCNEELMDVGPQEDLVL